MAPQPLPDLPESVKRASRTRRETTPFVLRSDPDRLKQIAKSAEQVRRVAEAAIKNGK